MRSARRLVGAAGLVSFAIAAVVAAKPAAAFHTPFAYRVERFEADGNTFGALDGVPGWVDEFADGTLSPSWYTAYGTAVETGGFLVLQNPGVHFPSPTADPLDLSIAASSSSTWVYDGSGSFTATAWWEGVVPPVGHHFHFSLYTFGGGGGLYSEIFGLAMAWDGGQLSMEQHLTEIDQYAGIYQNTQLLFHAIDANDVTGTLGFRISVDDATNQATTAFSLDGGATWQSPFPTGTIFVGRSIAQFLLSADPVAGGSGGTTTTTTVSSSTTTTMPVANACVPTGCRRSLQPFKTRLSIKDKASPQADTLHFKWKKGEDTPLGAFGSSTTYYDICIGDGAGNVLFEASANYHLGACAPAACWHSIGTGWKFTSNGVFTEGIRKVLLKGGADGRSLVALKAQGEFLSLPSLPLPLPLTVRLSNTAGECWAEVFTASGVQENSGTKFSGKAGSPSGAFVD